MLTAKALNWPRKPAAKKRSGKAQIPPGKDLGGPAALFIKTLAVFIVSQFAAAFIIELILAVFFSGNVRVMFNQSIIAQFFFVLLAESAAAYLVYWLVKRRRLNLGFIGLGRRPRADDVWKALLGYGVLLGTMILVSILVSVFLPSVNLSQKQNLGFNNPIGFWSNLLTFIALVILPPLGEEPLVRGYLYSGLRTTWRFAPAALGTSVFFGLAHLEFGNGTPLVWAAGIETFFLSVVLCYLRERTGALYAGVLVHMLNNTLAFIAQFH